ncbi:hypothetical protein B0I35DRAFT_460925 [Stachybotrys elegans]|uniref:Uncharacterized protein n=1 Tax=Stachybotrys elegans TaxID=80388 RepID=A0A8K0SQ68_9HYPO|nr:hypothetical protein B0I35DRAFT_460925 [Stachybotrys elegans]
MRSRGRKGGPMGGNILLLLLLLCQTPLWLARILGRNQNITQYTATATFEPPETAPEGWDQAQDGIIHPGHPIFWAGRRHILIVMGAVPKDHENGRPPGAVALSPSPDKVVQLAQDGPPACSVNALQQAVGGKHDEIAVLCQYLAAMQG